MLIDDHPVVAVGVGLAIRDWEDLEFAGTATDPETCIAAIEDVRPDALIIDLVFSGVVQLTSITRCRAVLPEAAIIVFSSLPERLYGRNAIEAGADAYVNKATDLSTLLRFVSDILSRPKAQRRSIGSPVVEAGPTCGHLLLENIYLTAREAEIARGLSRGLSVVLIARAIGISSKTVAVHRDNIRKKLNCRDTKDLVARLARMEGLGDAPS